MTGNTGKRKDGERVAEGPVVARRRRNGRGAKGAPLFVVTPTKRKARVGMTKTPISLQDLRRSLYVKAKAEPTWRFWGLYVHVCKMEALQEAYRMAKNNDGLVHDTYQPMRVRKKEIPKDGGTNEAELGQFLTPLSLNPKPPKTTATEALRHAEAVQARRR
jgi:hypothetical protein